MKNIFALAAMMAATLTLSSCEKGTVQPLPPTDGAPISISFVASDDTRGFGDSTAQPWEKEVNTATIMVFDNPGKLVYRRDLSAAEITAITTAPIALAVPGVRVGDICTFALVANHIVPTTLFTKDQLVNIQINTEEEYNRIYPSTMLTGTPRALGFEMSAYTSKAIASGVTAVSLTLNRVVAKVDIACTTTSAFAAKYGNATITDFSFKLLSHTQSNSAFLFDIKRNNNLYTFIISQNISDNGRSRFYILPKLRQRIFLSIDATYDTDGDPATTGDRTDLTYETELLGSGGIFRRNSAHFVEVRINGLTGEDVNTSVKVADWETIVTHVANVGN